MAFSCNVKKTYKTSWRLMEFHRDYMRFHVKCSMEFHEDSMEPHGVSIKFSCFPHVA